MLITSFESLHIQYDAEASLIRYQWQPGGRMEGFRAAMTHVLELVQDYAVQHCMLDLHGLPDIRMEDQIWLGVHWLPRVTRQQARLVALVAPASTHYNQMVVESLLKLGRPFIKFELQFFVEEEAALDWLGLSPAQAARIQQEWHAQYDPR